MNLKDKESDAVERVGSSVLEDHITIPRVDLDGRSGRILTDSKPYTLMKWCIQSDSLLPYKEQKLSAIAAPKDYEIIINMTKLKWRWELCFNGEETSYYKFTYLSDVPVNCEISLGENRQRNNKAAHNFTRCGDMFKYNVKLRGLDYCINNFNATINIYCAIDVITKPHLFDVVSLAVCKSKHVSRQVAYDYFLDGKFRDATLRLDKNHGSKEFAVHRLTLAAHSPYFAKLFESREEDHYVLQGTSAYILEQLLKYMYTEEIELEVIQLAPLCVAAARFAVDELTKKCCEMFEKILTKETAKDLLNEAETYDALDLRDVVIKFMLTKYPEMMAQSPKLREYSEELAGLVRSLAF